jgi:hypothetical protein
MKTATQTKFLEHENQGSNAKPTLPPLSPATFLLGGCVREGENGCFACPLLFVSYQFYSSGQERVQSAFPTVFKLLTPQRNGLASKCPTTILHLSEEMNQSILTIPIGVFTICTFGDKANCILPNSVKRLG